jgi:cob(I)alamin adenosyltransferase
MKWFDLTKGKGDDGFTLFAGERISKSHVVLDLVGEIDTLCAAIGMCHDNLVSSDDLQEDLRNIMGYYHKGGEIEEGLLQKILDAWTNDLEIVCEFMNEVGKPPSGWVNYDNTWYLASCHAREVERFYCLLWDEEGYRDYMTFPKEEDREILLGIFNRMSKLLYMLGVKNGRKNLP